MERKCCCCGMPITACMGCVYAGDFVQAIEKKIPFTKVRERCGKCVEKELLKEEG